jgi:signal recognition particle subunit SRP54
MAGLQGAGKTTTCAKLAKHMRDKHKKRPVLVAVRREAPGRRRAVARARPPAERAGVLPRKD